MATDKPAAPTSLGRVAYERHCAETYPYGSAPWDDLSAHDANVWESVAGAVEGALGEHPELGFTDQQRQADRDAKILKLRKEADEMWKYDKRSAKELHEKAAELEQQRRQQKGLDG